MSSLPLLPRSKQAPPPIIERPDLQTGQQRAVFNLLTGLFWLLWVVLWLPLVTLLGWALFGYQFHFNMIKLDGYVGFLDVLGLYALVIASMSGGLIVWAKANHLRFRNVDRRQAIAAPTPATLARTYGCSAADIAQWQQARIVTVHHRPDGRVLRVEA